MNSFVIFIFIQGLTGDPGQDGADGNQVCMCGDMKRKYFAFKALVTSVVVLSLIWRYEQYLYCQTMFKIFYSI